MLLLFDGLDLKVMNYSLLRKQQRQNEKNGCLAIFFTSEFSFVSMHIGFYKKSLILHFCNYFFFLIEIFSRRSERRQSTTIPIRTSLLSITVMVTTRRNCQTHLLEVLVKLCSHRNQVERFVSLFLCFRFL